MSIERPTFSENWHRVAELKPRLRAAVKSHRQYYRSRMWHVLADPISNQFFRLDEPAFRFMALLDGRRTVAESWRIVNEDMGDAAPTQGEAIQLLGQLYTSNLLQAELPPDSEQMFARYNKRVRREVGSYFMNFLFARFPIINPEPMLRVTTHIVGKVFEPIGFLIWLAVLLAAFVALAGHWTELWNAADPQTMLDFDNVILLGLCFVLTKAVHEMGHAYCCAHFGRKTGVGGPVHTIGIMLMVLMPVPYVDASSSWTFPNKWHRAYVAAAGMYVELFVAAVAAIVWTQLAPGVTKDLAFNVIFIASISTLLFNGNPLLRFDGYYILSDLTEIANLAQRSKQYLHYLVKRFAFGIRHTRNPAHSPGEQAWLPIYGVASFVYRIFICIAIFFYIFDIFPLVGAVMALMALAGWVVVPVGKFIKYLAIDGEVERVRGRAVLVSTIWFLVTFTFLAAFPMPDHDRAMGIVEPQNMLIVRTKADGFVRSVLPSASHATTAGEPLLVADNDETVSRQRQLLARIEELKIKRDFARTDQPEAVDKLIHDIESATHELNRVTKDLDELTIRAPYDGVWVSPDGDELPGRYLPRAEAVGILADTTSRQIRVAADQSVDPRIFPGNRVEVRAMGAPGLFYTGTISRISPSEQTQLSSPAMSLPGGGTMAIDPSGQTGTETAEPFVEYFITLDADQKIPVTLFTQQRVVVRFDLPSRPLLIQMGRSLGQLFQQRFSSPGGSSSPYRRVKNASPATR